MNYKTSWFKILLGLLFFWFTVPYLIIKYTKNKKLKTGLVIGWVLLLLLSVGLNASPAKNQSTIVPKNVDGVNEKRQTTEDDDAKKEAINMQEEQKKIEIAKKQQEITEKEIDDKKAREAELQKTKQEENKKIQEEEKQKEDMIKAEQARKAKEEGKQEVLENERKEQEQEKARQENIQEEQEKNNVSSNSNSSTDNCDPSYPTLCIPINSPDLNCKDIPQKRFPVLQPDKHRFDGNKDGIGCEK